MFIGKSHTDNAEKSESNGDSSESAPLKRRCTNIVREILLPANY